MQEPLSLYLRQKVDERSSIEEARHLLLLFRQRAAQRLAAMKTAASPAADRGNVANPAGDRGNAPNLPLPPGEGGGEGKPR